MTAKQQLKSNRKVLILGWDAADWKIINALIEADKMPHTAALIERGVMGNLSTLHPVLSPLLWTSIATGKRPFKHGILGFSEPTSDGGAIQPVSQLSRKTKAVWNILNQEGYRSNVIGWWPSHPVEPINGVMVSNHFHTALGPPEDPWPLAPGMIHPKRLELPLAEVRLNPNELVPEQVLPFIPKALEIDQDKDRRLASVMKILAECSSVHAAVTWAMAHEPWDFMAVYYDAIDHFCHGFMKYHPPRRDFIPERDYEIYHGVVEAGYRFHDMMLGAMLALAPEDTTVIVCSDHGFHSDHLRPVQIPKEPAGPAVEHRDLGILIIAGPGIKRDELIHGANLLDITPTILALYGLPVGSDMDGKPLLDAFETPCVVETVPSWDNIPGEDGRLAADLQFDPLAAKQAMDQLVALGYIDKPDANREKAIANTFREMRYNLARSYMDAGRYADAMPMLTELYEAEPDQYRFGVQLAMCYRTLSEVAALRALVEKMIVDRREAAQQAQQELAVLKEVVNKRRQQAGEISEVEPFDIQALTEEERDNYNALWLTARFSNFDLDYLMGWVFTAENEQALKHLQMVRHLRRERRMRIPVADGAPSLEMPELAPEVDCEGTQIGFDASPEPLVDKSAVPDERSKYLTVVTGLPRSGTSMMMQMLAAGGVDILTDGKRVADNDNPRGYFELESATRLRKNSEWLLDATGKAVKIVAQLLPFLAADQVYRVVFMERDMGEVLQSQKRMLANLGRSEAKLSDEQLRQAYRRQLKQVKIWLARQPNIKTTFVGNRDAIEDAPLVADAINIFLGGDLDVGAMSQVVDRSLYRQQQATG